MKNTKKEIIERWEAIGLLENLNDDEKTHCAIYFQKTAEILIHSLRKFKYEFELSIFAIIRKLVKNGYKFDNFNIEDFYNMYCNEYEKIIGPKYDKAAKAAIKTCNHFFKKNTPKIK